MRVKFVKKAKKSWSKDQVQLTKKAVSWACHELGLKWWQGDLVIRFVGNYTNEFGGCSKLHEGRYIVWLHAEQKDKRLLRTIFHELTHVNQHIYDSFELLNCQDAVYCGKLYKDYDYWTAPWEIEARKFETKLLKKYRRIK